MVVLIVVVNILQKLWIALLIYICFIYLQAVAIFGLTTTVECNPTVDKGTTHSPEAHVTGAQKSGTYIPTPRNKAEGEAQKRGNTPEPTHAPQGVTYKTSVPKSN